MDASNPETSPPAVRDPGPGDLKARVESDDPAVGLRAVGALHRLAEQVEATNVRHAREHGWSWEQIGDALGVSRQSVHAKYGRRL